MIKNEVCYVFRYGDAFRDVGALLSDTLFILLPFEEIRCYCRIQLFCKSVGVFLPDFRSREPSGPSLIGRIVCHDRNPEPLGPFKPKHCGLPLLRVVAVLIINQCGSLFEPTSRYAGSPPVASDTTLAAAGSPEMISIRRWPQASSARRFSRS